MRRLSVDPNRVWSWYPSKRFDESIPWENIPVPVFEIPPEYKNSNHDYILIEGSHRRLRAISMRSNLLVVCYEYGEEIDVERDGLAPFRHHDDSNLLYERLLKAYILRDKLPELMKSRQQPKATSPSTEPRATR